MATSVDTELDEFVINDVASDELFQEMVNSGELEDGWYVTPDSGSSGGGSSGGSTITWEVWE